jgi:hypothetical protein
MNPALLLSLTELTEGSDPPANAWQCPAGGGGKENHYVSRRESHES